MGDVLNEAYGIVQCKECPWYKSCVTPMRFTAEDLRRHSDRFGDDAPRAVDIDRVVAARTSAGGTAPDAVSAQMTAAEGVIADDAAWIDAARAG